MKRRTIAWLGTSWLCGMLAVGPACAGEGQAGRTLGPEWVAVDPASLAGLRGGFALPSGLQVSFGFERQVHVNGALVSALRVRVADVGRITTEEAGQLAALGNTQLVQIGSGNALQADVGGLVIQNTLNDQRIQVQTSLDVGVGTLGLLQALHAAESLQGVSPTARGGL